MVFKNPIIEDVTHADVLLAQASGDQDRAMTGEGFFLGAHDCNAILFRALSQTIETTLEASCSRQDFVLNSSIDVAGCVIGACPEFRTEKHIRQAGLAERHLEGFFVELGVQWL